MKILNVTGGVIIINDLPGPQSGLGLSIPPGIEVVIFDEDAEKSTQLASLIDAGVIQVTGTEEPSTGTSVAIQSATNVGPGASPLTIIGPAVLGQVLTAISETEAEWQTPASGSGPIPDASPTVKGVTKLSVAAATPTDPIAVGDNDPRMVNSRTPTGPAGGDLGGTYPNPAVAKVNGVAVTGVPSAGQVLTADSATTASWQDLPALGAGDVTGSGTDGMIAKWASSSSLTDSIISEAGTIVSVGGDINVTGVYRVGGDQIDSGDMADGASLIKTTTSLGGDLSGNLPNPTVAKVNGVSIDNAPATGQALIATSATTAEWQAIPGGTVPDASPTVKGVTKLSVAAVDAENPIAVGDNDARMTDARTPTGPAGGDLSGTYPNPAVAQINGVTVSTNPDTAGQVLRFDGASWASTFLASTDLSDSASLIKTTTVLGGGLSGNLPNPTVANVDGAGGLLADAQKIEVQENGVAIGTRPRVNLIQGSNISIGVADNAGQNRVDITISASGGAAGTTDVFNPVSLYQVEFTSGQTAWVKSSSSVHHGLSWTRSGTVLTVNHTAHGRSVGDRVIVRNTNVNYQVALVASAPDANSFTIATSDSGGTSGSSGAYSLGLTFAHDAAAGSITAGTLTAPASGNVQLLALRVFLAANTRQTTTYDLVLPASAVNGAGANTGDDDLYVPIVSVRQHPAGNDAVMTAVGATLTKAISGNFSRFRLAALGATSTPINIQANF